MTSHLKDKLQKRRKLQNLRELSIPSASIDFSSNDYLGFARSRKLASLVLEEWKSYSSQLNGLGSTGSRLVTGHSAYIAKLEEWIAHFHRFEAGLIFNCGYMANLGLLSTVAHEKSIILFDSKVHASTRDGIRLSRAEAFPFKHNDCEHLKTRLRNIAHERECFICVESIDSTDGSQCPLIEVSKLANEYRAHLIVDEAHAVGVFGPMGRGLVAELNLSNSIFAQINTFGKALGTQGAIILGSNSLKEALINFSNPCIYTTALPFFALAAIKCSYDLMMTCENERSHLQKLIEYMGLSKSPIQPVAVKGNKNAKLCAQMLARYGFDVRPFLSPTVQKGDEILRVCLHAFNTEEELAQLIQLIRSYE